MTRPPRHRTRLFSPLPAAVVALATAVAGLAACRPTKPPETPAELFAFYCARCHADDGRGVSRQLERYPKADLTRSEMLARGDRAAVLERTAKGYGPMPAFATKLKPAEIEKVTDFVLALGAARKPND